MRPTATRCAARLRGRASSPRHASPSPSRGCRRMTTSLAASPPHRATPPRWTSQPKACRGWAPRLPPSTRSRSGSAMVTSSATSATTSRAARGSASSDQTAQASRPSSRHCRACCRSLPESSRWVKPSALATMSRSSSRPPAMRACSTSCARRSYRRRAATERQQTTCAKRSSSYASSSFRSPVGHSRSPTSPVASGAGCSC
mmetsp:Transcript_16738/g.54496  ORF Transcript_16738/g.54496 Transcript_16738/m.54496 type:complete len:202 (+) Transcript_16738:1889-2494(+)